MKPENSHDLDQRLSRLYDASVPESFETGWRAIVRREESIQQMNNPKKAAFGRIWKKAVPVLCTLVLVLGGLWTGMMEDGVRNQTAYETAGVTAVRSMSSSASNSTRSKSAAMGAVEMSFDTAAAYDGGIATYGSAVQPDRKLVRTADLTIRTNTYDDALSHVQNSLADFGGYIENLYQYGETTRRISLTLRIPAEKLDAFLSSLEGTGKVIDRSESTMDLTAQYADQQARLNTLYEKRTRLNELLVKAENVEDLIEIENAIAETQYQIDSYETSQRSIDRQVDMSAVNLTLVEQEQTVVNPELTLAERIRAGFTSSLEWFGGFLRDVVVFAVIASPVIAVCAAGWLIWKFIRKFKKREG